MDSERPKAPVGMLDRLRQLVGYRWEESTESYHSSYDIWHVFGTKNTGIGTNTFPPSPMQRKSTSPQNDSYNRGKNDRNKESGNFGNTDLEVVARISVHTLRAERSYHNFKSLALTVDPNGYHIVRPIDIKRLPSLNGHDVPLVACIFESPGQNHLSQFVDYGPAWYKLRIVDDNFRGLHNENFVADAIPLQKFLDFSIGAAECIEKLHSQQIVHGEIRGDAFHMNKDNGRIRLLNLGSGPRTFEHALTSTGWSTISKELGAKTKFSYMSPEQTGRMAIEPDSRTDVYSLGIVFRTILLRKPAFEGETPMDIIQDILGQQLPSVSNARTDIPEVIGRIIQKATAKTILERYQSVSGLRHDLIEVRRLLQAGDSARLLNWEIAEKDVCPFFNLPETMVGRSAEHDAIVEVIDNAFKSRQDSQSQKKPVINYLSRLSEGQFARFDMALTAGIVSLEDDNASSVDETTNSLSFSDVTSENLKGYKPNTRRLRSPATSQRDPLESPRFGGSISDSKSSEKRNSTKLESVSVADSNIGDGSGSIPSSDAIENMIMYRSDRNIWAKGRCEVITIAGGAGLGKSRLIKSIQVEARRRGYFSSSKFDQATKTPFGPVLKLLSSLFKQVYSESNMDPVLHQSLKQHVEPVWPTLHKVLNLPKFLLGPEVPARMASQTTTLSTGYHKNLVTDLGNRDLSSSSSQSNPYSKTLGAQSSWDFLRVGASTKSLPLMNTLLDILRIFTRHKFVCFCLDDLHLADEDSLELIAQIISTRIKMVIILTYRPEDLSSEKLRHILELSDNNETPQTKNLGLTTLTLKPLDEGEVLKYVADTLHKPIPVIFPLGVVIQSKTGGNPFYMREMLSSCHRKKCIWYDYRESGWLFDLDRIFEQLQTENYDDTFFDNFAISSLNELPVASRSILAWASILGSSFSFKLIQRLMNSDFSPGKQDHSQKDRNPYPLFYSEQDTVKGLQAVIQACIVMPTQYDDIFRFTHDRHLRAAASLLKDDRNMMHFIMAQTLLKYYSLDDKYRSIIASSIEESASTIKKSLAHRRPFRKFLFDYARTASENGLRSTAAKLHATCITLLQDDMWNDQADDVYYEETLQVHTAATEYYLYRGQHQDARRLLLSVSSNAKTAVDKAPSWILQSRMFAQEGNSTGAFEALKKCLVALEIKVDSDTTFPKCDSIFKRLCKEIEATDKDTLVKKPMVENSNLAAVGAVLVEATSAAFWSDTLTFYQMTLIMVDTYLSFGSFPQAGMGFLQLALIAITRHNMINFANECGNIALVLIGLWKDPYTIGRGGTIYSTFVGHIQHPLKPLISQLEGTLEFAVQAGDRISTILNFGLVGNLKFFASENLVELEAFCTYGCQDIPNWQWDTPGGTMIITIRQVCRALQGKTKTRSPIDVMSDDQHNSPGYKSWLMNTVKNSDRPLMLYESIEIAPLFLYGHYSSAVALGNSCLKKINAIWSARNTRFVMFFHGLSLAGSIWIRVQEQLDPAYRTQSPQLSSDIDGRSFEAGLQEEIVGLAMMLKYFKRKIEQWQAVTNVNYLAWSKLLGAQIAEMEDDHTGALRLYEDALNHASTNGFVFEEALAQTLLGGHLLRIGSQRLAKTAFREAISLYWQFGATGVANHIEAEYRHILREATTNSMRAEVGIQTDPEVNLGFMQPHTADFEQNESQVQESLVEDKGDRIALWQAGSALANTGAGLALHMLDLTSILQSSQVLSSVLQVDQLLKTMCEIILQNCKGVASLAAIVIEEDEPIGWGVAASGDASGRTEVHIPSHSLKNYALVAESVVNYCIRFRESVFLPDLLQDSRFSNVTEAWIARNASGKSVVALPICYGDDNRPLLGVLYVEGPPYSFTTRNLEVLQLLVYQLGISYSNALTLKEVERVSALNKSMVEMQKKALSEAIVAERNANMAKAEALRNAKLAEEAANAKTSFLANISHELRTPLNGIIANSELLLGSKLETEQAEMADSIQLSADLLLNLINDVLDFSKIEAHKMQLHPTTFNANAMVQGILRSIPTDIKNKNLKNVRIVEDICLPQSMVYGDPLRLHQILGNLVSNSLKFTEKGTITIGAKTEWETQAAVHLTFWTKDTGIGIPSDQLHKLFKPFSQADSSTARKYGGTGLGLSICKSLVESMGGTIKLESTENVGTCVSFTLTLPKSESEASADDNQIQSGDPNIGSPEERITPGYINLSDIPHSQLRVCIAEDNLVNQKVAVKFLQKLNFKEFDVYDNGLAVVEGIRKKAKEGRPYHITLMDVQMPIMDGYEATKLLRKDSLDAVRGLLVIALTASAIQGDREKCLAAGMNDYLAKPVRLDVLKKKFSQYIQLR